MISSFALDGKTYAVGLTWQVGTAEDRDDMHRRAKALGADLKTERDVAGRVQYGLAATTEGYRAGMYAAAAIIADSIGGTWHGVFQTPEGLWYIACRDGIILPGSDQLFTDPQEARDYLERQQGAESWQATYAPEPWRIEAALPATIRTALSDSRAFRLRPLTNARRYRLAFAAVVAVSVIAVLYGPDLYQYLHDEFAPEPPKPPPPVVRAVALPAPWQDKPAASPWLALCSQTLRQLPERLSDWLLADQGCRHGIAEHKFTRQALPLDRALRRLREINPRYQIRVSDDGNAIWVTLPFASQAPALTGPFLTREAAKVILHSQAQRTGDKASLNFQSGDAAAKALQTATQSQTVIPYAGPGAQSVALELQSSRGPGEYARKAAIAGLVLESATNVRGTWSYRGTIYLEK